MYSRFRKKAGEAMSIRLVMNGTSLLVMPISDKHISIEESDDSDSDDDVEVVSNSDI